MRVSPDKKEEERMEATVYVLVGRPDTEKAKADLEAIGWKAHGIVTFTTWPSRYSTCSFRKVESAVNESRIAFTTFMAHKASSENSFLN